jgi:hypothetical protein
MIGHISLLIIAVCLSAVVAKDRKPVAADTSQMSIDTTPPVVKILPQEIYHGSLFHVTFSSNKPGIIWYSVVSPSSQNATMKLEQYKSPITITDAGMTRIYFQGEDLLGNRSHPDSMTYVIDTRQPVLSIFPESGRYRAKDNGASFGRQTVPLFLYAFANRYCHEAACRFVCGGRFSVRVYSGS